MLNKADLFVSEKQPMYVLVVLVALSFWVSSILSLAIIGLFYWLLPAVRCLYGPQYRKNINIFLNEPEAVILASMLAYAFVSLVWSDWNTPRLIAEEAVRLLISCGVFVFFAVFWKNLSKYSENFTFLFVAVLFLRVCILLVSFFEKSFANDEIQMVWWITQPMLADDGIFYHHSQIAYICVIGLLLSATSFIQTRSMFMVVMAMAFIAVLAIAQSRASYLSIVVASIYLVVRFGRAVIPRSITLVSVGLIILVAVLVYYNASILDWLLHRSDSGRFGIWSFGFSLISENFLIGHGFGSDSAFSWNGQGEAMHLHSMYFSTLYYGGLFALLLFLFLISMALHNNYRINDNAKWSAVLIAGLVIFIFDGDHFLTYPSGEFYLFLFPLLIMTANKVSKRKVEKSCD